MTDAGLKLPNSLGAPERTPVNKRIHERWDTFSEVTLELQQRGFVDCPKPETEFPNLTAKQLTETPNKEYTALHANYLDWFRYIAEAFSNIRALHLQVKNEMEDISLDLRNQMRSRPGKKPTAEELDLAIGTHARYRELKQLAQRAEQGKMLLETRVDYLERSMRVISRQVELRKIDAGQEGVNNGMPSRNTRQYAAGYPAVRSPGG